MTYKLIAADMDGTLLTNDKRITPRTADAIRRATEAGAIFCLSTGRPLCSVRRYLDQLGLSSPVIACNGAIIVSPGDGRALYEQGLEPDDARKIWALSRRFGTTVTAWARDRLLVSELNERIDGYTRLNGQTPTVIEDFDALADGGLTKMLWIDEPDRIKEYIAAIDGQLPGVNYCTSSPRFLEFFDGRVSKARAMERLGGLLGVAREEMIAIGDGENDLPMLTAAGLGVAMGNAADSIKAVCGYVTASNEDDGVAEVIDRFIFG